MRTPRRTLAKSPSSPPFSSFSSPYPYYQGYEYHEEDADNKLISLFKPVASLFIKMISFQLGFFSYCTSYLATPMFSFISMASDSLHRADVAREKTEDVVLSASKVPSRVAETGELFLKKVGFGLLGALYMGLLLIVVLVFSVIFGVGLVRYWVEEPVFVKEVVYFDYTEVNPTAVLTFVDGGAKNPKKMKRAIPAGHTFDVSLVLLMPESDFNRQIGVFQVAAEIVSSTGHILARSSQPCMLRFRSFPIRLTRTFVMGVPLLLGISSETQKLTIPILHHIEGNPATWAIKTKLQPRAGTFALPELYSAEILMNSQLPWSKQLVHNWKWTFYVWTSLYVYIMLLITLFCCCKQIFLPTTRTTTTRIGSRIGDRDYDRRWSTAVDLKDLGSTGRGVHRDAPVSDFVERWERIRRKRKALCHDELFSETVGSSASSVTYYRDDMSTSDRVVDDYGGFAADEESFCLGG
ncbi:hypothetical protein MKW98_025163 [Papaver atlanticum]|uniref:Seipin n=1 Tax=Papaver atlanticum TaxID=357466 RepID=A0AAD4S1J7_9MAGN|nr:hypothetical protein MKW98_025163 [Papaver atlanticum]